MTENQKTKALGSSTTRKQIPKQRVKYVYVFIMPSTSKDVKAPLKTRLFRNKG